MLFLRKQQNKVASTLVIVALLLLTFAHWSASYAATNQQINYQGKLTDTSGVAVADGTYNMRFWLLQSTSQATTSAVWTESLTGTNRVQVTNGLFSVMLGSTSALTSVDFNQTLYLGVEIGGTGGSPSWDGEMSPRKILGTVPAAFEADNAQTLDNIATSSFLRSDQADAIAASVASPLLTITQSGAGDILNLFDGATEVFTVTDGGRVGIGTSTPNVELAVDGDFELTGGFYDNNGTRGTNGQILQTDGAGVSWVATSSLGITSEDLSDNTLDDLSQTSLADPGADQLVFWDDSDTQFEFISTLSNLSITGNTLAVDDVFLLNSGDSASGVYSFSGTTTFATSTFTLASTTNFTINGENFTDLTGTGLALSGTSLTTTLGTDITAVEIADGDHGAFTYSSGVATLDSSTVSSSTVNASNWQNGYVLQASTTAAGGFDWVATSTLGIAGGSSVTFGTDNQIPFTNAGGTDFEYSSNFTFDGSALTVSGTGSFTGTTTFATSTFALASTTNLTINGENFTDLTGTGLQNTGGALTLNATGDWTGTLDGIEGANFLRSDTGDIAAGLIQFTAGASTTGITITDTATTTNLVIGGDNVNELAGTGLTVVGNALTADLGTDISAAEIADGDHGDFTYSSGVASLDNDVVTPDTVLAAGQTDEYCLTYEETGDTWGWFNCAALGDGSFLGLSDVGISSYADGSVLFTSGTEVVDDRDYFYYDAANKRLAIGDNSFTGVPSDTDLAIISTSTSQKARLTVINTNGTDVEGIFDARNDGVVNAVQFGAASTHPILVQTAGTERMLIGTTGGIRLSALSNGIADVTNPDAEIDLEGDGVNVRFDSSGTARSGLEFYESGSARMTVQYNPSADTFVIRDEENTTDRVTLTQEGLVAIGTTTDYTARLSVQSAGVADILNLFETDGAEVFTVLEDGNVGVGTSSPYARLSVAPDNAASTTALAIEGVSADNQSGLQVVGTADTDGDDIFGSKTFVGFGGGGSVSSADRNVYGSYTEVDATTDADATFTYYPYAYGNYIFLDSATDLARGNEVYGNYVATYGSDGNSGTYTGNNTYAVANLAHLLIGGSGSLGYGDYQRFALEDEVSDVAQTAIANYTFLDGMGPLDTFVGFDVVDQNANISGGTAYGARIDLDDTDYTDAWSLYVNSGSADSYFGSSVGIATTSPSQLFSVAGNALITGALYDNSYSAGTNGQVLQTTGSGFAWVSTSSLNIAETNSLETTITDIADTEIFIGNGADSGTFTVISGDATLANSGALTLAATNNNLTTLANVTTVGALNAGSITSGFGDIDNGTSNITTGGIARIDVDGTGINAAGSLNFGAATTDSAIYWNGTNLEIDTSAGIDFSINGTPEADLASDGFNLITGDSYQINNVSVLDATTLGSSVVNSSLTTVGTIGTGVWEGTAVADTYVADDLTISASGTIDPQAITLATGNILVGDGSNNALATSTLFSATNGNIGIGTTTDINAQLSIQTSGTQDILNLFETGGSEVFTVLESGNVGVGDTAPQGLLHIATQNAYTDPGLIIATDNTNVVGAHPALQIWSINTGGINASAANAVYVLDGSTGYTGIGTTTPFAPLTIVGNGGTDMLGITIDMDGDSDDIPFRIRTNASGGTVVSDSDTRFVVTGLGNVGVGTSSPSQLFSVAGNALITGALYDNAYSAGTNGMVLQTTGSGFNWVATSSLGLGGGGGASAINDLSDALYNTTDNHLFLGHTGGSVGSNDDRNIGIGQFALDALNDSIAVDNLAIGYNALTDNYSGDYNLAIGSDALNNATTSRNIGIGYQAGYQSASTTGVDDLSLVGYQAGYQNSGDNVSAFGYNSAYQNTGIGISAIGHQSAFQNTGANTTAIGQNSAYQNTGGSFTAAGYESGYLNTGDDATAIGHQSGYGNTGNNLAAIGYQAGYQNTADSVVALGYQSAYQNHGDNVTAAGYNSLRHIATSTNATVYGTLAGRGNTGGAEVANLTAFGYAAGLSLETGADNNLLLGFQAGDSLTTGNTNIAIGYDVELPSNTANNQMTIGNLIFAEGGFGTGSSIGAGGIAIGTSSADTARLSVQSTGSTDIFNLFETAGAEVLTVLESGNVGIGVLAPSALLSVQTNGTTDAINIFETGGTEIFTVLENGNVGIGDATPGVKLVVDGHISQTNTGQSIFVGEGAGAVDDLTTNQNVYIGYNSGNDSTNNTRNVMIGHNTFSTATSTGGVNDNTGVGHNVLAANTTGVGNVAVGSGALAANTTGSQNVAIGLNVLSANTTGFQNTAVGYQALAANTTGFFGTAYGLNALAANTSGGQNTAVGANSLIVNTTGNGNTALGYQSLNTNLSGGNNTALGYNALRLNQSGSNNTAVGQGALDKASSTSSNTAVGSNALLNLTSGGSSVAIGDYAGTNITTGSGNTIMGSNAAFYNQTGSNNVLIGQGAGLGVSGNSFSGVVALGQGAGQGLTTGSNNILIGLTTGDTITSGSNNLLIGHNIDAQSNTADDQLSIGNIIFGTGVDATGTTIDANALIAIGTSTPVARFAVQSGAAEDILNLFETGGSEVFTVLESGRVGIGTSTPESKLHFYGDNGSSIENFIIDSDNTSTITAFRVRSDDIASNGLGDEDTSFKILGNKTAYFSGNGQDVTPEATFQIFGQNGADTRSFLIDAEADSNDPEDIPFMVRGGIDPTALTDADTMFVVDYLGRVGVGTTTVTAKTHILNTGSGDSFRIDDELADASPFVVDASGGVGISTSSPSQLFSVAGNALITGALYDNNYSAGTNGMVLQSTGSGFQWVATSSLGINADVSTGDEVTKTNVLVTALRDMENATSTGAAVEYLQDGVLDIFTDASNIDTVNSVNESLGSGSYKNYGIIKTLIATSTDNSDASSYTITDVNIGTASETRLLVFSMTAGGAGTSFTGLTVNGTAATERAEATNSGVSSAIYSLETSTSSATATIAVTAGSSNGFTMAVYEVDGYASAIPYDTDTTTTGDPISTSINLPTDGGAVFSACERWTTTDVTFTWSGLTEDADLKPSGSENINGGFASDVFTTAQTGLNVDCTPSAGSFPTGATASWEASSTVASAMTLISSATEAQAEPTESKLVILAEGSTTTLSANTHIKGYVSLDDGANWEQVTLTNQGLYSGSTYIYEGVEPLTDRNDQTMRYKIETATGTAVFIHGVAQTWGDDVGSVPDYLTVNGDLTVDTNLLFADAGDNLVHIGTTTGLAKLNVQTSGTTDILNLYETAGAEVFTVLESGNVGIGTTTPAAKLSLDGNFYINGSSTAADGIDEDTTLMLHMDGTDASTVFTDSSASAHTVATTADAQIDTAQSKFGGASGLFDGTGDYISVSDHADFEFGSGDFTIDLWFRASDTTGVETLVSKRANNASFGSFAFLLSGSTLQLYMSSNGSSWDIANASSIGTFSANTWHHVAVTRSGSTIYKFLDGVSGGTISSSASLVDNSESVYIGAESNASNFNGHIDELRFSKGTARWTSAFTPPTSAYSAAQFDDGGIGIGVAAPVYPIEHSSGAYLSLGGAWTNSSDVALKENFVDVNRTDILANLSDLNIQSWNYKAEDPGIVHVGPTAQDFYGAFGLNGSDTSISTIDSAGIALVGVQSLLQAIDISAANFATSTLTVADGFVRVGTSTTPTSLEVVGSMQVGTSSTPTLLVDTAAQAVSIGTTSTDHALNVEGDVNITGSYLTNGADYAEFFYTRDTDLQPGEAVCIDITEESAVERCTEGQDGNVMGIVSTQPSILGNASLAKQLDPHYVAVAMLGQIPARVSDENGAVRAGDSLTSASSTPGFVMKANAGDPTVAIALENLTASSTEIQVLISRRNKSITVAEVEQEVTERIAAMEMEDEVALMLDAAIDSLELDDEVLALVEAELQALDIATQVNNSLTIALRSLGLIDADTEISSTTASTTPETVPQWMEVIIDKVVERITDMGTAIVDGVAQFASVITSKLTVGSSEVPAGIQMYDPTGAAYCVLVATGGELVSVPGSCEDATLPAEGPTQEPVVEPEEGPETPEQPSVDTGETADATEEENSVVNGPVDPVVSSTADVMDGDAGDQNQSDALSGVNSPDTSSEVSDETTEETTADSPVSEETIEVPETVASETAPSQPDETVEEEEIVVPVPGEDSTE